MKIADFVRGGVPMVINSMREKRYTSDNSIVFPNGYVGSIVKIGDGKFSVATCDYDGYFNWDILKLFTGFHNGSIICDTEEQVCNVLTIIKSLKSIR